MHFWLNLDLQRRIQHIGKFSIKSHSKTFELKWCIFQIFSFKGEVLTKFFDYITCLIFLITFDVLSLFIFHYACWYWFHTIKYFTIYTQNTRGIYSDQRGRFFPLQFLKCLFSSPNFLLHPHPLTSKIPPYERGDGKIYVPAKYTIKVQCKIYSKGRFQSIFSASAIIKYNIVLSLMI